MCSSERSRAYVRGPSQTVWCSGVNGSMAKPTNAPRAKRSGGTRRRSAGRADWKERVAHGEVGRDGATNIRKVARAGDDEGVRVRAELACRARGAMKRIL